MITDRGVEINLIGVGDGWRVKRLADVLALAQKFAERDGIADVLAHELASLMDHEGTLVAQWGKQVWETDNAVEPDLPMVWLCIEDAWKHHGEYSVNHVWGNANIWERQLTP